MNTQKKNKRLPQLTVKHMTLAFDTLSYSPESIELAVNLAAMLKLHLQGLFIEDAQILEIAGLPFTTEITLSSGQERGLSPHGVQRARQAVSARYRMYLSEVAGKQNVSWSYSTKQGERISTCLQAKPAAELLIIDHPPGLAQHISGVKPNRMSITVLDNGTPNITHIIELIARQAKAKRIELTIESTNDENMEHHAYLESLGNHPQISVHQAPHFDPNDIRENQDLLVAPANLADDALQNALEAANCSVILI